DRPLAVLGQSLGGALAPYAISRSRYRRRVKAVVLDSTFASFREITREKLASLWLTWPFQGLAGNVEDAYSPARYVADLAPIPLLLTHNLGDEVVPAHHAWQLFQAAREPKRLWMFPGGGHAVTFFRPLARDLLASYLWKRFGQPGEPPAPPSGMPPFRIDTL
ncbi:MAG TPA: alpha/beta hydrolase, partial [Gammaproteobacteria bacterium]|nr:alpha/beta hydrolase [Gammaproteobacteria bacterium]